jgi:hypothetical protein
MLNKIKLYLKTVLNALRGRPTVVLKEQVLRVPFTESDIQSLKKIFPVRRIGNTSVRDLLITEGQQQVIEYVQRTAQKGYKNV